MFNARKCFSVNTKTILIQYKRKRLRMKNGNFAIFKGKEYSADYIKGKGIVLRSKSIEDLNRGFQKYKGYNKSIVCIKFVERNELDDFYRLKTKAIYVGHEFEVVEEKDNKVSIVTMRGDYKEWLKLDMKCIDKGVYQKWIDKSEVEIIVEKECL